MFRSRSLVLFVVLCATLFTAGCFASSPEINGPTVAISTSDNPQSVIDAHGEGTTFVLASGTHNGFSVRPKSGQKFFGEGNTVLNGNGNGTAFTANLTASDVVISNMEITGYSPGGYEAVIDAGSQYWGDGEWRNATNWTIDNVNVHSNGGAGDSSGIEVGSGTRVANSRIENNAGVGIFANARNIIIESSIISGNANSASNVFDHSGGMKLVMTHNATVRNNVVNDNNGPGVWFDISADNAMVVGNTINNNSLAGVQYEISRNATIVNNTLDNNAWGDSRGWLHQSSIMISSSHNVTVEGNRVSNAPGGITVVDQHTLRNGGGGQSSFPGFGRIYENGNLARWRGENVKVTGNTLTDTGVNGASAGEWESYGSTLYATTDFSGNTFNGSTDYWWGTGEGFANSVGAGGWAGHGNS